MIANEDIARIIVQEAVREGVRAQQIQRALQAEKAPRPAAQPGRPGGLLRWVRLAIALLLQS